MIFNSQYGNTNAQYGAVRYASLGGAAFSLSFTESVTSTDGLAAVAHAVIPYGESVTTSDTYALQGQAVTSTPSARTFAVVRENRSF